MKIDISDLGEVEQWIILESINRLREGQKVYGVWDLDKKENFYEQVCELIDRTHYDYAEKLKRKKTLRDASKDRTG